MLIRPRLNNTFRRNLLLNLISATLVIVLVLFLFFQMIERFREQERTQREDMMQNEILHISNELNVLGSLFLQSKYSDSLQRIALIKEELYASDYYALNNAQNYLSSIASANGLIADIVLNFSNSGILLTRDNTYISPEQFVQQYQTINFDSDLFLEKPSETHSGYDIFPGGTIISPSGISRRVAFIYRIPLGSHMVVQSSCHAYLLISYDALMDALLTENMREYGSLELLDGSNRILCAYSAQKEFSRDGTRVSVCDPAHVLQVNAFLPEVYFSIVLQPLYAFVSLGLLAVFALGVFMAWIAAWQQALPMRRLISDIAGKGLGRPEQQNEYAWLRDNLQRMNGERADIAQQLAQHQKQLYANALERLFAGAALSPQQRVLVESSLSNLSKPFLVGLARFHFSSDLISENAKNARGLVMFQKLERTLPNGSIAYPFDSDTVALLIPCPHGQQRLAEFFENSFVQSEDTEDDHSIELTLGTPLTQIQEIAAAFDSVLQDSALEQAVVPSSVHCVQNLPQEGKFSFKNIQQLYNLLLSADIDNTRTALMEFLLSMDRQCGSIHQRFYTIRAVMMLAAYTLKLDDAPIRSLHYATSNDGAALLEKFCTLLPLFSGQVDTLRLQKRDTQIQSLMTYFQEHFSDPEFCPAAAAAAFSISEKHLYMLLKENTSRTPAAYLLEIRLNHASSQLRETNKPVQQICEECGFSNLNTFYKAFKRAYAVSPSQYRSSIVVSNESLEETM